MEPPVTTNREMLMTGIEKVLEEVRPLLAMHGGDANLMSVTDGIVHLKLEGTCHGCSMSVLTFGIALKEMLQEKFPTEITQVTWE